MLHCKKIQIWWKLKETFRCTHIRLEKQTYFSQDTNFSLCRFRKIMAIKWLKFNEFKTDAVTLTIRITMKYGASNKYSVSATCYGIQAADRYDVEVVSYGLLAGDIDNIRSLGNLACSDAALCFGQVRQAIQVKPYFYT